MYWTLEKTSYLCTTINGVQARVYFHTNIAYYGTYTLEGIGMKKFAFFITIWYLFWYFALPFVIFAALLAYFSPLWFVKSGNTCTTSFAGVQKFVIHPIIGLPDKPFHLSALANTGAPEKTYTLQFVCKHLYIVAFQAE
jgi:hypothetical protein